MKSLVSKSVRSFYCKIFSISVYVLIATFTATAQTRNSDEIAVRDLLQKQIIAWNKGNIDEFMKGYLPGDSLVFIGKSGPKYSYKTILENYRKNYPDTTAMGQLKFDLLQVKQLSPRYFYVIGKFYLKRTIGDLEGHFTLLFEKIEGTWFIIADHSS